MSPQRKGSKRGAYKPPRDRKEIVIAVLASLAIIAVTVALVWFLRPNRESEATPVDTTPVTTPTTVPGETTTVPGETTTVPPDTAPASSTP